MKKLLALIPILLMATVVLANQQTPFYAKLWTVDNNEGPECERMWWADNSGNIMARNCTQELMIEGDINGTVIFTQNMNIFAFGESGPTDGNVHIKSLIFENNEPSYTMTLNGRIVNSEIIGSFVIMGNDRKTIIVGRIVGRVDNEPVELIGKFIK